MNRVYTIPLRRTFMNAPFKRRTNKAVKAVREYVLKHTKADRVVIGEELNDTLWARGITNPPHKVKVEVTTEEKEADKVKTVEAFVNLPGITKKVVEQKKKGILAKEDKAGLKGKLQEAVSELKGNKEDKAEVAEAKPEATEKTEATSEEKPKAPKKTTKKTTKKAATEN